jgi:membrane-associated protease RseP (regulator of RpoE activity)
MPEQATNILLDGTLVARLRADLEDLFAISEVATPQQEARGTLIFRGQFLNSDVDRSYDRLAARWTRHEYTPMLRRKGGQVELVAVPGVVRPKPSNPWINFGLFVATILSVLFVETINRASQVLAEQLAALEAPQQVLSFLIRAVLTNPSLWRLGIPFTLVIVAILLTHELGHYFAARHHHVAVTLPYFIPIPIPGFLVGTMGAFIQLRAPVRNKKQLFDVGVAGPLAGLVVAIPLLVWGVAVSKILPIERGQGIFLEGNSILYLSLKYMIHNRVLPSWEAFAALSPLLEFWRVLLGQVPAGPGEDILLSPIASAAWIGLLVTVLNLLPIGQLDGGHISYTLLGSRMRFVAYAFIGFLVIAGFVFWQGWLFWAFLTFFLVGPTHPPPLNDVSPLGGPRRLLGYAVVLLFILIFMPLPIRLIPG